MSKGKRRRYLSKSKLISAWQCPKKLYLDVNSPELGDITSNMESLFETGHQVGAVAQKLYGTPESVEIPFNRQLDHMVDETKALIDAGVSAPIFEATFQFDGILVRVDMLIPDGGGWRVIEVKASTSVKDYHVLDCAIQDWVMRNLGFDVKSISLAHINNQFVYQGNGGYEGLLVESELTEEVRTLEPQVIDLIAKARNALADDVPDIPVGTQCNNPYDCHFQNHCWPTDTDFPIRGLGGSRAKLAEYVAAGYEDIRDVSAAEISAETQLRIHQVTQSGQPEVLDGARHELEALPYPRYYLDFETIGPAVPIWPGMRPYRPVPVQWSCHIDDGSGDGSAVAMRHAEFLDLSGEPPMRALAEQMIDCLGESGPVLMYTTYERTVIQGLITMFPDLEAPLQKIIDRLYDLHPVVRNNYYHPNMLGSWSIKAVLPCVAPSMSFADLEGISEGMGASEGYLEAIDPGTSADRKAELEEQLRRYCKFDTEAMVEIVRFFTMS